MNIGFKMEEHSLRPNNAIPYESPTHILSNLASFVPHIRGSEEQNAAGHITIPNSILTNLREQISLSLLRTKYLEEKAKQVPLLQVQMSVLKEEKRLLQIQLKSKRTFYKSIGVGDGLVTDVSAAHPFSQPNSSGLITPTHSEKFFSFDPPPAEEILDQTSPHKTYNAEELFGLKSYIELKKIHPYRRARAESSPTEIYSNQKDENSSPIHSDEIIPKVHFPDILPKKSEPKKVLPDLTYQTTTRNSFPLRKELPNRSRKSLNDSSQSYHEIRKLSSDTSSQTLPCVRHSKAVQVSFLQKSVSTDTDRLVLVSHISVQTQSSLSVSSSSSQTVSKDFVDKHSQTISHVPSSTTTSTSDLLFPVEKETQTYLNEKECVPISKDIPASVEKIVHVSKSTLAVSAIMEVTLPRSHEDVLNSKDESLQDESLPEMVTDKSVESNPKESKLAIDPKLLMWFRVLNDSLLHSNQDCHDDLAPQAEEEIRQSWFAISSHPTSEVQCVKEYLDVLEDISLELLKYVVNLTDVNGNTALHYAVSFGNYDVINVLVGTNLIDVSLQNKAGYTCIMLMAVTDVKNNNHRETLRPLLKYGDINFKALHNGQTALMLAASQGHFSVVQLMVESGADVNLQDQDGSSALMCAAEHGHADAVKLLLSNPDCDPFIMDNDGCMALNIAMDSGHKDVGVLIYAHTNLRTISSKSLTKSSSVKSRRPKCALARNLSLL